jgi:murein DD-endopeptidase MepM/ murein hydrolase activator NlpD
MLAFSEEKASIVLANGNLRRIGGPPSAWLEFPLDVDCGGTPCTAYTAKVGAVHDHSGISPYVPDNRVQAFSGEAGVQDPANPFCGPSTAPGYQAASPASGKPFLVGVLNYVGASCIPPQPAALLRTFLNYDGHPGYDYSYASKSIVAPANGVLFKAQSDPINGTSCETSAWDAFHTFYIDHLNGFTTWYLHAETLEATIEAQIGNDLSKGVPVQSGQTIATSGDYWACGNLHDHLHFEVRRGLNQLVDPYAIGLWGTDTDGDGMLDGDEVILNRNPLVNEGALGGIINFMLTD